ncbi:MAG: hypothetical protein EZS26_000759 [Candidatus Ordinivivax streblomastigis]|uniref:Uncharacterized protein n=1 Tax=Candidatus Ordinivivax streblomastigis TaxID=2540710 RepID=A0A5M8P4A0_9BACT|nr:MAG: hypothetical protein EZS26_000759 [Candidatus Ordinivivax streblomastigis]
MAQVKDIIEDNKFNEFLQKEIDVYNKRPAPGKGLRYKRTPYDGMKDNGIFNVEGIRAEFVKLANKESRLPRAQKDAISGLVFRVAQQVVTFREKEAKGAGKEKQSKKRTKKAKK